MPLTKKDYFNETWISRIPDKSGEGNVTKDFFTESKFVTDLVSCSFDKFLKSKDIVLVMFYVPWNPNCCFSKKHVDVAAETTVRKNHAYAAVNCSKDPDLCDRENVDQYPLYKFYSRGYPIGTFREYRTFTSREMRKFVENAPVIGGPKK